MSGLKKHIRERKKERKPLQRGLRRDTRNLKLE